MWSICVRRIKMNQRGQVLPVVFAVMSLAALVVGPFLAQASSTLIGSHNYGTIEDNTYSADAGIEPHRGASGKIDSPR